MLCALWDHWHTHPDQLVCTRNRGHTCCGSTWLLCLGQSPSPSSREPCTEARSFASSDHSPLSDFDRQTTLFALCPWHRSNGRLDLVSHHCPCLFSLGA